MAIKGDLYTIQALERSGNESIYHIRLNKEHRIFAAHFPNNPILPGVCLMEIARETASTTLQRRLRIRQARSVKFQQAILPGTTPDFLVKHNIKESETTVKSKVTVYREETIFAKLDIEFRDDDDN